jgi:hypothetical protein
VSDRKKEFIATDKMSVPFLPLSETDESYRTHAASSFRAPLISRWMDLKK